MYKVFTTIYKGLWGKSFMLDKEIVYIENDEYYDLSSIRVTGDFKTDCLCIKLRTLREFVLPSNLKGVREDIILSFQGVSDVSGCRGVIELLEGLQSICSSDTLIRIIGTDGLGQSEWDWIVSNVINSDVIKFSDIYLIIHTEGELVFDCNTKKRLGIVIESSDKCSLVLNGVMGDVLLYWDAYEHVRVNGTFDTIIDNYNQNIVHKVVDYDGLPNLYESLSERLERLVE